MVEEVKTTLCLECGTDTSIEGYINRLDYDKDNIDGWKCGPCQNTYESLCVYNYDSGLIDFDDDKYDAYLLERFKEVDNRFEYAPAFRIMMETCESWSEKDVEYVESMIKNYKLRS